MDAPSWKKFSQRISNTTSDAAVVSRHGLPPPTYYPHRQHDPPFLRLRFVQPSDSTTHMSLSVLGEGHGLSRSGGKTPRKVRVPAFDPRRCYSRSVGVVDPLGCLLLVTRDGRSVTVVGHLRTDSS